MKKIVITLLMILSVYFITLYTSTKVHAFNPSSVLDYEVVSVADYNSQYKNNPNMELISYRQNGDYIYERYYLKTTLVVANRHNTGVCVIHNATLASTTITATEIEVIDESYEAGLGFTAQGKKGVLVASLDIEGGYVNSTSNSVDLSVSKTLVSMLDNSQSYSASGKYCLYVLEKRATIISVKISIRTQQVLRVEKVVNGTFGVESAVLPKTVPTTPPSPSC